MGPRADDARGIVASLREAGMNVGLRDVSFAVLSRIYGDPSLAYRCLYGDDAEISLEDYSMRAEAFEVSRRVESFFNEPVAEAAPVEGLSFDELKQGLIDDMNALIALRDQRNENGESPLDPRDMATIVARIADIRVKLTEKFNTTERVVEQRVVVNQKFDSVCPHCHHEIAVDPSLFDKK